MINYLLWVVLPHLDYFFTIIGVIGLIASCVFLMISTFIRSEACGEEDEEKAINFQKLAIKMISGFLFCLFMTCFIPGKKEIIALKAASIVSEINGVENVPQKLIDRLNDLLDDPMDPTDEKK